MIFKFRIFLTLFVLGLISVTEQVIHSGDSTPEINVYAHGPIKGKFGWTVWTRTTQLWGKTPIKLTYAPAEWTEISASVGLETNGNPLRYAGSVWLSKGRFPLLSLIENGGNRKWYKNVTTFKTTSTTAVGILDQRYITSPYAEIRIGKAAVWGLWTDGKSGLIGLRFNFGPSLRDK